MIRAYKVDDGYTLRTDDGIVIPLTENEGHALYLLVAAELERVRRTLEEPEAHDA